MNGFRKCHTQFTIDYYSAIKKNGILPFATIYMDLEALGSVQSVRQRKEQILYVIIKCGNLKK